MTNRWQTVDKPLALSHKSNNGPRLEVSTVWIFTLWLPWTVVGFVTHCQRFVNSLNINVNTNTIFLKWMKKIEYWCSGMLAFWSILRGDSTVWKYSLNHTPRTRACLEWKFTELPTTFVQLYPHSNIFLHSPATILKGLNCYYYLCRLYTLEPHVLCRTFSSLIEPISI